MKRILFLVAGLVLIQLAFATDYNISISGTSYKPSSLTVKVGDRITIAASSFHPLVQVDENSWNSNDATPMQGGWGTKTAAYTFTALQAGTIYYVCQAHVSLGMKGTITVEAAATAIDQPENGNNTLQIYPNPLSGLGSYSYYLPESRPVKVQILSLNGSVVKEFGEEQNASSGLTTRPLDVADLPDGIYLLVLDIASQRIVQRFVLMH